MPFSVQDNVALSEPVLTIAKSDGSGHVTSKILMSSKPKPSSTTDPSEPNAILKITLDWPPKPVSACLAVTQAFVPAAPVPDQPSC